MNGWVLLHKKIWASKNFRFKNKSKMILVWIWLLTHCDENGDVTAGRNQIATDVGISSSSVQRVIDNMRSLSVSEAIIKANNKANKPYTDFHICNWSKYQRKADKQPTANRLATDHQPITNKEVKNKEEYVPNFLELESEFPNIDVEWEWKKCQNYFSAKGRIVKNWESTFSNWLMSEIPKKPRSKSPFDNPMPIHRA